MEIRGITHCHSNYSYDAKHTLPELREFFIQKGIQFVCMTEHTDEMTAEEAAAFVKECEDLSDEMFRFIPGFEVPYKVVGGDGDHAHVLMIGARIFFKRYAPTMEVLRPWINESKFVVLAHPVRNAFIVDSGLLDAIDGLEVWNQQYEGKRVPRIRSLKLLKELRERKPELVATGGVDLHRMEHWGSPIVTLDVERLEEDLIIEKLKTGAYIVSSARAHFYGTLPDVDAQIRAHRLESHFSVMVIVLGKCVNALCARLGFSLPKSLKRWIRKYL